MVRYKSLLRVSPPLGPGRYWTRVEGPVTVGQTSRSPTFLLCLGPPPLAEPHQETEVEDTPEPAHPLTESPEGRREVGSHDGRHLKRTPGQVCVVWEAYWDLEKEDKH